MQSCSLAVAEPAESEMYPVVTMRLWKGNSLFSFRFDLSGFVLLANWVANIERICVTAVTTVRKVWLPQKTQVCF